MLGLRNAIVATGQKTANNVERSPKTRGTAFGIDVGGKNQWRTRLIDQYAIRLVDDGKMQPAHSNGAGSTPTRRRRFKSTTDIR